MPPKRSPSSPSPTKKRKSDSVQHGVDFFFKRRLHPGDPFVKDERDERRRQEEEDEKFARDVDRMQRMQEVEDEEFARQLARTENERGKDEDEEDIYGDQIRTSMLNETPRKEPETKPFQLDSPKNATLEDMNSIPLEKPPLDFDPATDAPIALSWSLQRTPYAYLTYAFTLINSTRSRLQIQDYLINTLRVIIHHDPSSLLPLVWLTTNSIAPSFEDVDLNLGSSVITKALKNISGLTGGQLSKLYNEYGDVGDVAFHAKMAVRTLVQPAPLTVKSVYATLRDIARAKGQGSSDTKRRLVERLLVSAKGEEVRYIGRTLVQHVPPPTTTTTTRDGADEVTYRGS
jgi:DNA ligase N terminus